MDLQFSGTQLMPLQFEPASIDVHCLGIDFARLYIYVVCVDLNVVRIQLCHRVSGRGVGYYYRNVTRCHGSDSLCLCI